MRDRPLIAASDRDVELQLLLDRGYLKNFIDINNFLNCFKHLYMDQSTITLCDLHQNNSQS